jgi:hypothetical protein
MQRGQRNAKEGYYHARRTGSTGRKRPRTNRGRRTASAGFARISERNAMDENGKALVQSLVDDVTDRFRHFTTTSGEILDLTNSQVVNDLYADAKLVRQSPELRKAIDAKKRELDGLEAEKRELTVKQHQVSLQLESWTDMKITVDALAVYVREHYAADIAAGRHAGRRLEDVLIGHLEKPRQSWLSWLRRKA